MVIGAGGRAGHAITTEAVRRGHQVTAIVRDPARHPGLDAGPITVTAGDALDAESIGRAASGARALVSAVTPFSEPPASFDGFDTGYYAQVVDTLIEAALEAGVARLVVIGLFASLRSPAGGMVADDPAGFPPPFRPFAHAHAAGVDRLRETGAGLDWLVLAPPPNLTLDVVPAGGYSLGDATLDPRLSSAPLSYQDLARAAVDEIDNPTRHQAHTAVYGT